MKFRHAKKLGLLILNLFSIQGCGELGLDNSDSMHATSDGCHYTNEFQVNYIYGNGKSEVSLNSVPVKQEAGVGSNYPLDKDYKLIRPDEFDVILQWTLSSDMSSGSYLATTLEIDSKAIQIGQRLFDLKKNLLTEVDGSEFKVGETFIERAPATLRYYGNGPVRSENIEAQITFKIEQIEKQPELFNFNDKNQNQAFLIISFSSEFDSSQGHVSYSGKLSLPVTNATVQQSGNRCLPDPS